VAGYWEKMTTRETGDFNSPAKPGIKGGGTSPIVYVIEMVSKSQITLKNKAWTDEKAQHTSEYVSILRRSTTPLLGVRWGFETISNRVPRTQLKKTIHTDRRDRSDHQPISA
jgi:hypothetical protein